MQEGGPVPKQVSEEEKIRQVMEADSKRPDVDEELPKFREILEGLKGKTVVNIEIDRYGNTVFMFDDGKKLPVAFHDGRGEMTNSYYQILEDGLNKK